MGWQTTTGNTNAEKSYLRMHVLPWDDSRAAFGYYRKTFKHGTFGITRKNCCNRRVYLKNARENDLCKQFSTVVGQREPANETDQWRTNGNRGNKVTLLWKEQTRRRSCERRALSVESLGNHSRWETRRLFAKHPFKSAGDREKKFRKVSNYWPSFSRQRCGRTPWETDNNDVRKNENLPTTRRQSGSVFVDKGSLGSGREGTLSWPLSAH